MKNFIRKIWNAIVAFIEKVPYDKLLHFCVGLIIAAIVALPFHIKVCFWAPLFAAVAKEMFDAWTTQKADPWDFVATMAGGLLIQILAII